MKNFVAGDKLLADELNESFNEISLQYMGDGSDGDVVISSNTSLSSDMFYNNLTINDGIILKPNGYRIFVKDTLTFLGTGKIQCNGGNGGNAPNATIAGSPVAGGTAGAIAYTTNNTPLPYPLAFPLQNYRGAYFKSVFSL